jgi:hypothetical protein
VTDREAAARDRRRRARERAIDRGMTTVAIAILLAAAIIAGGGR